MDPLHDPDSLRDHPDVDFIDATETLPAMDFEETRERIESHAVVGITNTDGEVLLMNDGDHGWTLTAFPVEEDDEWTAVARLGSERVTGLEVAIAGVERVRQVAFVAEGTSEQRFRMETVIFRAAPVEGRPVADEFGNGEPAMWNLRWVDSIPDGVEGGLAADIQLFLG